MLRALDLGLLRLLRTRGHGLGVERAAKTYALAGEWGVLWVTIGVATGLLGDPRERSPRLRGAGLTVLAFALNYAVKLAVRRRRPELEGHPHLGPTVSGLSYPSAHATTAFTAAGALAQTLPSAPLYAGATAMALTRPYLGVHYPSDVLAGAALGTVLARLAR